MTRNLWIGVAAAVLCGALTLPAQRVDSAESLLQAATKRELVDGNLAAAIEGYKKAIAAAKGNRGLAAQALLQLGQCYRKQGNAEARRTFERLLREYADQGAAVAKARDEIAALGGLSRPSGITLRKVWAIGRGQLTGSPSPDGRYYSFADWETGDLALRDLATGQNRRLTNKGTWRDSDEYAEVSVISGDGRQIAYAWYNKEKFYELRVMGMDGSNPRTVYRDKEFGDYIEPYQWTADGKQILANLGGKEEYHLALIPAAGGPVRVLKTPSRLWWWASLSPDGRFLAYEVWKTDDPDPDIDISLLPLEGGQEVTLVQSPAKDIGPVWMPTGDRVLFVSNRTGSKAFWTIDVVEGKPRGIPRLLKDGVAGAFGHIGMGGFTRGGDLYFSTNTGVGEVYVTELDPAEGKMLRPPAPIAQRLAFSNLAPSWSPDGRRLAFYRRGGWQKPPTLVIHSVETGEASEVPVKLKQLPYPVRWFPDGKSVVVSARDSSDLVAIYRVDIQTGDLRLIRKPLAGGGAASELSPDGNTLFYFSPGEPKLRGGVISYDIETGQEREIARVPYFVGREAEWARLATSPDGRYLAFRSPVDEAQWTALRLVPVAGGELRELIRFRQSETASPTAPAWTPDGRNVLLVRRTGKDGMPELWRIPIAGGEPQRTGLSMGGIGFVSLHPDGRRIAFESGSRGGVPNELWVLANFGAAAK